MAKDDLSETVRDYLSLLASGSATSGQLEACRAEMARLSGHTEPKHLADHPHWDHLRVRADERVASVHAGQAA